MALTSRQACNMIPSDYHQNHLWVQAAMHHEDQGLMDSYSSPSGADNNMLLVSSRPQPIFMSERRLRPPQDQTLKCPRCDSSNTKFCYYNNYSLSQPRYFCKTCRRYWTRGGTLRNIPVGGGCRKNLKKSSTSKKSSSSNMEQQQSQAQASMISTSQTMMMSMPIDIADIQLSFHTENAYHQFAHMSNMMSSSGHGHGGYLESKLFNSTSLLENSSNGLIRPIDFLDHRVDSLLMNTHRNGFLSSQFGANYLSNNYEGLSLNGHDDNVQGFGYATPLDDLSVNYLDSPSKAHQSDYTQHGHHQNISSEKNHDVKPKTTKLLALDWQPAEGCYDARASKESFGYAGSWSGMMTSGHNINCHH